jgi:hypothetical protein
MKFGTLAFWAAATCIAGTNSSVGAAIFTVGADASCTYHSVQQAIAGANANGAGSDEIRLPAGEITLGARLTVSGQSLQLVGGFTSCLDAAPSSTTQLSASSGVLGVHGFDGAPIAVGLQHLAMSTLSDRVVDVDGPVALTVLDSKISGGAASGAGESGDGGGLRLRGANVLVALGTGTLVQGNHADGRGGGVYCDGGASVLLDVGSSIDGNQSGGDGGGLYADHCNVEDDSGGAAFPGANFAGLVNNTAGGNGGGAFLSSVALSGEGTADLDRIAGNHATAGGGLYVTGGDSTAFLANFVLENNSADDKGGALFVTQQAVLNFGRDSSQCPGAVYCARIDGNSAPTGSALYADAGAQTKLQQIAIRANPPGLGGAAIDSRDANTLTLLEGAVLYGHAPRPATHTQGTAWLRAAYVSSYANGGAFDLGVDGHVSVYSSVIQDNVFLLPPSGNTTLFADCDVVKEDSSFPAGLDGIEVLDNPTALFKNPGTGDLRPRPQSPAIDRCDTFFYSPTTLDVFGFARGFDVPSVFNDGSFGNIDSGAIEAPWIFAADFD